MRLLSISFLTLLACSIAQAKSFHLSSFFFGGDEQLTTVPEPSPPSTASTNYTGGRGSVQTKDFYLPSNGKIVPAISTSSEEDRSESSEDRLESYASAVDTRNMSAYNDSENIRIVDGGLLVDTEHNDSVPTDVPVSNGFSSTAVDSQNSTIDSGATFSSTNSSCGDAEEMVVLGTTKETISAGFQKTILQKTIDWMQDTYTLSILLPVAAGVLFATTIIATIALCRCLRRCCRRRKFRKALPDSIKSLSPPDRKRLLGDISSDDEF